MIKQEVFLIRTISAIFLVALFLLGVYQLPHYAFKSLLVILALVAAWEWCALSQIKRIYHCGVFLLLCLMLALSMFFLPIFIIAVSFLWWLFNIFFIINFPRYKRYWYGTWWIRLLNGALFLIPMLGALVLIYEKNNHYIVLLMALVWSADIIAYLVGGFFGYRPLAKYVSPKKTIEGLVGSVIGVLVISTAFLYLANVTDVAQLLLYLALSLVLVLFSAISDLYESLFKRAAHLKDSSKILPGHGGLLDRIDSLAASAPLFYAFLFFKEF